MQKGNIRTGLRKDRRLKASKYHIPDVRKGILKINYMRIIIILLATIAIYSTAFYRPKCEHVFAEVEQPEIQIKREGWVCSVYTPPPSGKQEGEELICVKCFHKQKQIVNYGNPIVPPDMLKWPSGSLINYCDTLGTFGPTLSSGGIHFIIGDTFKYSLK